MDPPRPPRTSHGPPQCPPQPSHSPICSLRIPPSPPGPPQEPHEFPRTPPGPPSPPQAPSSVPPQVPRAPRGPNSPQDPPQDPPQPPMRSSSAPQGPLTSPGAPPPGLGPSSMVLKIAGTGGGPSAAIAAAAPARREPGRRERPRRCLGNHRDGPSPPPPEAEVPRGSRRRRWVRDARGGSGGSPEGIAERRGSLPVPGICSTIEEGPSPGGAHRGR